MEADLQNIPIDIHYNKLNGISLFNFLNQIIFGRSYGYGKEHLPKSVY